MDTFLIWLIICVIAYLCNSEKDSEKTTSKKFKYTKTTNKQNYPKDYPVIENKKTIIHEDKSSNSQDKWWAIRQEVLKKYGYKCSKCGSCNNVNVHHKIPLSKGGTNNIKNLIPLCRDCHEKIHGFKFGNEKKAPMENYGEQIPPKKKNTTGYRINDAIEHGYKLEIEYITQHYPFENETNIRTIRPQDIKLGYEMMEDSAFIRNAKNPNESELVFIVAFCELRNAIRCFRLDRIKILKVIK